METERLISRFRSDVHDTAAPYLWSDEEALGYADEAQKWLVRESFCLSDSTSSVAQIAMTANDPWGVVDPRVLKIRFARRASDNGEIDLVNFEDIQAHPTILHETYGVFPMYLTFDDTQIGAVRALVEGMETNKVRWMYVPAVSDVAKLIVYRLPLETISLDNIADLEVEDKHHIHLLDGMKAQAYKKEDAETFDKARQEKHEALFAAYCDQARLERERREHKPRTVRYGGVGGDTFGGSLGYLRGT